MGRQKQGRRTTKRAIEAIDSLTLILGSVEDDVVGSLRQIPQPLMKLQLAVTLLADPSSSAHTEEPVLEAVRRTLLPLAQMVEPADIIPPPFSPDLRHRIGYTTALLTAMRNRLGTRDPSIPTKVVRKEANRLFENMDTGWTNFRHNPTLDNLERFELATRALTDFYQIVGIANNEPRVRSMRRLCDLLEQASDRGGEIDDVPALVRKIDHAANELSRATEKDHRHWLDSVR